MIEEYNGKEKVYIVDLGFACLEKDSSKIFPQCGTPGYMAPEVLQEQPYDTKVDIFSLGVIFYILLTLKHPFYKGKKKDILENNAKCEIDFDILSNFSLFSQDLL